MAAPAFRAVGALATGVGAITPNPNASHASGDIEILCVASDNGTTCTLSTAAGFAAVTGGQAVVGVGPSTSSATATLFWRRWNGTDGSPTVADTGNHTSAFIASFSGGTASDPPYEAVTTSTDSTNDTSGSAAGGTTSDVDRMVVIFVSDASPDLAADPSTEFSGWTNANLTSLTERKECTVVDGNGGGLALATGVKATAGAIGNTDFTLVTASQKAMVTLAIIPAAAATPTLLVPHRHRGLIVR